MEGIDAFASGNYALRVPTNGQGELKELCFTFNRMASTVQENVKENLIRNRMLDEKLQELWEIYELTRNMSLSLELNTILKVFLDKAQTLSFSAVSQIIMLDSVTNKLEVQVQSESMPDVKQEDYENALNSCFLEGSIKEKVSLTYSMIFIPLLSGGKIQGVLFLAKRDPSEYSEGIKRFLQTISPVAASIIDNVRLYQEISEWNSNVKNIIESVSTGLGAIDRKGNLILSNEAFLSILPEVAGYGKIDSISEFLTQLSDQDFAQKLDAAVQAFLLPIKDEQCRNRKIRFKASFVTGENYVRELEVKVFPLLMPDKVRGCVIVFEDITEQTKIEHQMVESEKWAVLGKLAASVAHEIRNPLVAIRSLVELIGEEVQGELKEHVSVILGEVYRLNRVVAELLSFVRPEAAKMKAEDMNRIVNELVLLVRHEASRNGIELAVSLPEKPCMMRVDSEKIKQAFLNVFLNGIQAAGQGGKMTISVEKKQSMVKVCIGNNGPAISENMREKIFEAFFTTKPKGTGVGLAITRKIAELHNGRIEVESDKNYTSFNFLLPSGDIENE
jgi:signal transduction histidine kinase